MKNAFLEPDLPRRRFVQGLAAGGVLFGLSSWMPHAVAAPTCPETALGSAPILSGREFDLVIAESWVNFTGQPHIATTVNGSIPAPTLPNARKASEFSPRSRARALKAA